MIKHLALAFIVHLAAAKLVKLYFDQKEKK